MSDNTSDQSTDTAHHQGNTRRRSAESPRKLSDEDQARVDEYLSSPVNRVARKPFRPWLLLFWLWVVVMLLGGVSLLFGRIEGYY